MGRLVVCGEGLGRAGRCRMVRGEVELQGCLLFTEVGVGILNIYSGCALQFAVCIKGLFGRQLIHFLSLIHPHHHPCPTT